jgi:3-deoxy-D-manno-octulosonate 8-phosphate phosphatase (KDO 8-P phosphatase)
MNEKAKTVSISIKLLVMDVDGTLTDGRIYLGANGELMKAFNSKDGYAISNLMPEHSIIPIIITGRESKITAKRAHELGITKLYQGIKDKISVLKSIAAELGISLNEIAYIGDDLSDLSCIKACGLSGCPADAVDDVKYCVDYISKKSGGFGAIRDFVEWIITNGYA